LPLAAKHHYAYLLLTIDLYSRSAVGWKLAHTENAALALEFISKLYQRHGIGPGQLTLHADNGSPMLAKCCC